jgi:hypothetical protein
MQDLRIFGRSQGESISSALTTVLESGDKDAAVARSGFNKADATGTESAARNGIARKSRLCMKRVTGQSDF